jgi:hypothetical protein
MAGQNSQSDNLRGEVTNFGKQIDFSEDLTEGDINGYIAWRIAIWTDSQYRDRELWIAFIDDFDDFKKDTFDIASKDYRSKLRDYLRANGVFVRKQPRLSIATELYNVLAEEEPHKWTMDEIVEQANTVQGLNSILRQPQALPTIPSIPRNPIHATTTIPALPAAVTTIIPVPPSTTTITGHGRELGNLAKMYQDKMKYGGAMDSFSHKLTVFHDLCGKADVPRDIYTKAFSTMLREDALDYYYDNVNDRGFSFEIMCDMIRSHFETEEHKQGMMTKWNTTTLKTIIAKNEDKTTEECLELVIKELRTIQRGLAPELRTEQILRDKLINACNDVEACVYACLKPAPTLEGVCSDLQSSIIAYKRTRESKWQSQAFYTDRKYRHNNRYRDKSNDNFKKRCLVCKKEGCWSTNHPENERKEAMNKLNTKFQQFCIDVEGESPEDNQDNSSDSDKEEGMDDKLESFVLGTTKMKSSDWG